MSCLDLSHQEEQHGARHVHAAPLLSPRQSVQPVLDARSHQRVPGGMELDLVDPVSEPVVSPEARRILVRKPAPLERLTCQERTERCRTFARPPATLLVERFDEQRVLPKEVVTDERRWLIRSLPRRRCGHRRTRRLGTPIVIADSRGRHLVHRVSLRARLGATRGGSSGCFG
jgi:hypothetical protein